MWAQRYSSGPNPPCKARVLFRWGILFQLWQVPRLRPKGAARSLSQSDFFPVDRQPWWVTNETSLNYVPISSSEDQTLTFYHCNISSLVFLPYQDTLLASHRKYRGIWKALSFPEESFQKLICCAVTEVGSARWQWAGQAPVWQQLPGDRWSYTGPGDRQEAGMTGPEEAGRDTVWVVYLDYIPFTELIKNKVSFHLPWNLRTLACPLQQSTYWKQLTLMEAFEPEGDPCTGPCKHRAMDEETSVTNRPGRKTRPSHGKQRELQQSSSRMPERERLCSSQELLKQQDP